jgi:serralysin
MPNTDFALARINTNGSLDTDFDGDGKLYLSYGQNETYFSKITVQPNGKTLAVGHTRFGDAYSAYNFAVARINADGTYDPGFGDKGAKSISLYDSISCYGSEIALLSDNKIMVAGTTNTSNSTTEIAIARLNPDGSFDETFDGDGKLTMTLSSAGNGYYSYSEFEILPNGKVLIAGTMQPPSSGFKNTFVARLNRNF